MKRLNFLANSFQNNSNRYNALTGVRFLAVCLVFIYHNKKFWRAQIHPEFLRFLNEFHLGVSLFFVLSGFLIGFTYQSKPLEGLKEYSNYISLRMARILPLYWLILTLYYLDSGFGKGQYSWYTYTLTHAFSNKMNLNGIGQAWSLNVEMCFYFCAPVLFYTLHKKYIYFLGVVLLIISSAFCIEYSLKLYNGNPLQFFSPTNFILTSTFQGRISEFIIGLVLAYLLKTNKLGAFTSFPNKTWIGFISFFIMVYLIGLFQPTSMSHGSDNPWGMLLQKIILPPLIALFFLGLLSEKTILSKFLGSKIIVILGNASFAFYLIHISYVNLKLKQFILMPDRNFILLWIVALLLYYLVEHPIYSWFRKNLKG